MKADKIIITFVTLLYFALFFGKQLEHLNTVVLCYFSIILSNVIFMASEGLCLLYKLILLHKYFFIIARSGNPDWNVIAT